MEIIKEIPTNNWRAMQPETLQVEATAAIEAGKILLLPQLPFELQAHETMFLSPLCAKPKSKNISFNTRTGSLRGAKLTLDTEDQLTAMLQRFSVHAEILVRGLFPAYIKELQIGRTSYRPVEILGRASSYRKDDTRLHVDAFPATPNQGHRILRVFTNINPHGQARVWRVGEPFVNVAKQFLPLVRKPLTGKSALLKALKITKTYRTEYDHVMLQIHDQMKASLKYQANAQQQEIHFQPGSTWIVQTDHVSHAAMSGQYVLEQTFYLPITAMQNPDLSPLRTLEKLLGRALV